MPGWGLTKSTKPRERTANQCRFWACTKKTKVRFCPPHLRQKSRRTITKCPNCILYKEAKYPACFDCKDKIIEQNPEWDQVDSNTDIFYAYVLKIGHEYYAGQTRSLRNRLLQHKKGRVPSTKGKRPRLVWFTMVTTRDQAAEIELAWKNLITKDPVGVRKQLDIFRSLMQELDQGALAGYA